VSSAGFKQAIPASERQQTRYLDRAVTVLNINNLKYWIIIESLFMIPNHNYHNRIYE
jgi:hypothetical protein